MNFVIFTLVFAYGETLSRHRHTDEKFHIDTIKSISAHYFDKYAK